MPWEIIQDDERYCVHKKNEDGTTGEVVEGGCHPDEDSARDHMKALYANVNEISEQTVETPITESQTDVQPVQERTEDDAPKREIVRETSMMSSFQGKPPDIPAEGVDVSALTKGDEDPVFVTLKIAEVGRVSTNGILYDGELVDAIVEQINRKHPGGIFGHIKEQDRNTAFPIPDALWVGATRIGDEAWAKAYIRNRAAAEYVRHLKAVAGQLGTSIYGAGLPEKVREGVRRFRNFVLEQLDFAPPERASLQVAGQLVVTSEMQTNQPIDENEDNQTMDEKAFRDHLLSLSPDALAELISDDVLESVAQVYGKRQGKKLVAAEMVTTSAEAETRIAELTSQFTRVEREANELRTRVAEYEQREYEAGVSSLIAAAVKWETPSEEATAALNSARSMVRESLNTRMGNKRDLSLAQATVAELVEGQYQPVLAAMVRGLAGGSAIVGGKGKSGRESLYEAGEKLADELGVS